MRGSERTEGVSGPGRPTPTRARADLTWCIRSPSLLAPGHGRTWYPDDAFWTAQALHGPQSLPVPPDPHRFRLGNHFETLVATWVDHAPDLTLLTRNLQVFDAKRTVGEFDLLLERDGSPEHWELAVKFYLAAGDGADPTRWFGPNTADRFDLKFNRMREHQLVLSQHPAGLATLASKGIASPSVAAMVKGRLFHPLARYLDGTWVVPETVNPSHCRGWWVSREALAELQALGDRFVWLPKSLWLAPIEPAHNLASIGFSALAERVADARAQQAEHYAILGPDGAETSRGFVVSPLWIARTNAAAGEPAQ